MTKDFENLIQEDKLQYSMQELASIKRFEDVKKQQNSFFTNLMLGLSPLVIIAAIINVFYPFLPIPPVEVAVYLASIPAIFNVAIKAREIAKKNKLRSEFGLSNSELQTFLKSDKMAEFEDMLTAIQNGEKELDFIQIDDSVFSEYPDQELGVRLDDVQTISHSSVLTRLAEQLNSRNNKASNTKAAEKATTPKTTEKSLIAKKTATKPDEKKNLKTDAKKHTVTNQKRADKTDKARAEAQEDLENSI